MTYKTKSLFRREEYKALSRLSIDGAILDVGGSKKSGYHELIKGDHTITTGNIDASYGADIIFDAQEPWPYEAGSFDGVLLVNLLEHLYHYEVAIEESFRVLKPGGKIVVVVPFFFPAHPSPHDYWRFTGEALAKILAEAGFRDSKVTPLGSGVFSARYVAIDRLMPGIIRFTGYYTCRYVVLVLDSIFTTIARALRKKYAPADYALGFMITAER
jgi:SAM-dependent methyltransferase